MARSLIMTMNSKTFDWGGGGASNHESWSKRLSYWTGCCWSRSDHFLSKILISLETLYHTWSMITHRLEWRCRILWPKMPFRRRGAAVVASQGVVASANADGWISGWSDQWSALSVCPINAWVPMGTDPIAELIHLRRSKEAIKWLIWSMLIRTWEIDQNYVFSEHLRWSSLTDQISGELWSGLGLWMIKMDKFIETIKMIWSVLKMIK